MDINYKIENKHFNLKQIALSGQCFRMKELADGAFGVVSKDKFLLAKQLSSDTVGFNCTKDEFDSYWKNYFDLDYKDADPYDRAEKLIMTSDDEYLKGAFETGSGIRILQQDLWEAIVCFVISQNNNIKRITGSVDKICIKAGLKVKGAGDYYRIPRPSEVNPEIFIDKSLGLGYRDVFLRDLYRFAKENPKWLSSLENLGFDEAVINLKERNGIGPKVANCVCLFGLHHVDAFPIDTHIKQILDRFYPTGFDFERYKGIAGIIQQYMFFNKINYAK